MKFTSLLFFVFSFSILIAQSDPIQHELNININKLGAQYSFSFVHLTDTHIGEGIGDYGTEGVEDLPPEGDVGLPAERLRSTVNWLNRNYENEGIEFVVVSGDLTDSGEKSEFLKFKEIMDELLIPYVPLIGNHDVWPYTDSFQTEHPVGDSMIINIFDDVYLNLMMFFDTWDDGTRLNKIWNPQSNNFNFLQNFAFEYNGFHFLMCDFDTRHPARNNEPGIGPEAEIMDFEGGSWDWLESKVTSFQNLGDQNVFFVSHHPPLKEIWSIWYAFDYLERQTITNFLFQFKSHIAVWLAGHIHRNMVYQVNTVGSQPYQVFSCAETAANKEFPNGLFRIVNVYESDISTYVNDQMLLQNVDVYPNPSKGLFNLFLKGNEDKEVSIEVYDNIGRLKLKKQLEINRDTRLFQLDLNNFPKGMYYLKLENSTNKLSQNLILQ